MANAPAVDSEWGCSTWLGDQMAAALMTTQRLHLQARQIWEEWRPIMRRAAARTGCTPAYIKEKSHTTLADKSFKLVTELYAETVRSMDAEDREHLSKEVHQDVLHFMHRQFVDWSKEAEQ